MATSRLSIFISHSYLDNDFGVQLTQRLRGLLNNEALVWYDAEGGLKGGDTWWRIIVRELTARDIFIIILSPDAMQSPWVQRELDIALNEQKHIIPLLYRPCEVRADLKILQMVSFLPPKNYEVAFNELLVALSRWEEIEAEGVPDPQSRLIPHLLPQGQGLASGNPRCDWGEAPDVPVFFGRTKELTLLEQWLTSDRCRLVALVGMKGIGKTRLSVKLGRGGIGKTDLSLKLARGIEAQFDYVIWRRLLNAPKASELLTDLIKFLSNQREITLPDTVSEQIARLLHYLQKFRCLVILDNAEVLLQGGKQVGHYHPGYEEYGQIFEKIAEFPHQSCLLLTSREKPPEIARLESKTGPVRSLEIRGLNATDGKKVFKEIGSFSGSKEDWKQLNSLYNGNPLALELAARHIQEVFFGNISVFLREGRPIFADLRSLLDWHFNRISDFHKELMYWFAINREPTSLSEFKEHLLSQPSKEQISSTLHSLQRLIPLEKSDYSFTLQPVLIEYMTERFVEQVVEEVRSEDVQLFNTHALIKAQVKDYVREAQTRLILKPIAERLLMTLGKAGSERKLKHLLSVLREGYSQKHGYVAGNILNLLIQLNVDLRGYDFSHLTVWQAYLQGVALPEVDFSHAEFAKTVFTESFGIIAALAFNPAGDLLAAGTENGEVRLWRYPENTPYKTFQAHTDWARTIAFSGNGELLATGSHDQRTKIWNISTGECLCILHGHNKWVRAVTFNSDSSLLITASEDQTIRVWDVQTGECCQILQGHTGRVYSISYSPDGTILASGSYDGTVRLWCVSTGECLQTFAVSDKGVGCLVFRSNDELIIGCGDCTLRFWDLHTGKCTRLLTGHTDWIWTLAISPDQTLIASGGEDTMVRLWDVSTGECLHVLQGHHHIVQSIAFHPTDAILVTGSEDQTIRIWETKNGQCINILQGYTNAVWSVAFSPDDSLLASGNSDYSVCLWDLSNKRIIRTFYGHTQMLCSVAYKQDGKVLASSSQDRTVRLWDIESGECINTLIGHTERVYTVAFSPDSNTLVSTGLDQTVRLWNTRTGDCIKRIHESTFPICCAAYSPKGTLIATGNYNNTIQLWNIDDGKCVRELMGHSSAVWSVAFSGDGSLLASASHDRTVRVWDMQSGECLRHFKGHDEWVSGIAMRATGDLVASAGGDHTVRIWDIQQGMCIRILRGHTSAVWKVNFSADGKTLASCSQDGTIRLWNVSTGAQIAVLRNERPYERMNITSALGLTEAQRSALKSLGAVDSA